MKQSEIKGLSITELQEQLSELRKSYNDLKMSHAIQPLDNPLQLRAARRTVARLASELTKREL